MKYEQALEYMEEIASLGIRPGLDGIRALCALLGDPQDDLKFIHIAGTNGKGSVLAYVSTILTTAGYKVGRYSSPAVFDYCERIRVGRRNISRKALGEGMEVIREACGRMTEQGLPHPTAFEVETALGFWYFQKCGCDYVVLEAGMGGAEDATNIIKTTAVSVITSVSMDHTRFLGKTKEEIAKKKAGIIKPGIPVVLTGQEESVEAVIQKTAEAKGSVLTVADGRKIGKIKRGARPFSGQRFDYAASDGRLWKQIEIKLSGTVQPENAATALETVLALRQTGAGISDAAIYKGFRETEWEGRFSKVSSKPLLVADGAHNEDAAKKLAESIEIYFTNRRIIYIMGMLRDKEYDKVIERTARYADQIVTLTPPDNPRAMSAYELANEIAKVNPNVTAASSVEEAVELAKLLAGEEDVILAFGSLSFLGRLYQIEKRR